MSIQGPYGPTTAGTSNASGGTLDWSSPGNALAADGAYAQVFIGVGTGGTYYLVLTGLGFAVPAGAAVDGILVELLRAKNATSVVDAQVRLAGDPFDGFADRAD